MPKIRTQAEDFEVEELPLYRLSGDGPHTCLLIEKRLRTTPEVARDLANALQFEPRHVGYAGRKDKAAVTRQWFSVPEVDPARVLALKLDGAKVLEAQRNSERLRLGELRGNRFRLIVRDVTPEQAEWATNRFQQLLKRGLPNRFGEQRFGRHGDNAQHGAELLRKRRFRGDRKHAWFLLNALQSAIFNAVLKARPVPVDELMQGDLAVTHSTDALEWVTDPTTEGERLKNFEISPTGPMFGSKMRRPRGAAADLERRAMEAFDVEEGDFLRLPRGMRLYGERRSLRVRLEQASLRHTDDALDLSFDLPAGSYATVVVEELFPDGFEDAAKSTDSRD